MSESALKMGNVEVGPNLNVVVVKEKGDTPAVLAMISGFTDNADFSVQPLYALGSYMPVDFVRAGYSVNLTLNGYVRVKERKTAADGGMQGLTQFFIDADKLYSEAEKEHPEGYYYMVALVDKASGEVREAYLECVVASTSTAANAQQARTATANFMAMKKIDLAQSA